MNYLPERSSLHPEDVKAAVRWSQGLFWIRGGSSEEKTQDQTVTYGTRYCSHHFPPFLQCSDWRSARTEVGDCVHYSQIPCVISLQPPPTSTSLCWDLPLRVIKCIVKPSFPGLCRQISSWWNVLLSDAAIAGANQTLIMSLLSYFVFMVDESECIVTVLYIEKGGCERPRSWRGRLSQIPPEYGAASPLSVSTSCGCLLNGSVR